MIERTKTERNHNMKWVKFRIKTVTEAEDIIISTLYDLDWRCSRSRDKVP